MLHNIFKLIGVKGQMNTSIKVKVPQYKLNQNKTNLFEESGNRNLGRLGRINHTRKESTVIEKDIMGRLGRLFITPHIDSEKKKNDICKEYEIAVPSVPNERIDKIVADECLAVAGDNTEPEQAMPYVTDFGVLVIPWNSSLKYHYWQKGGQSVCNTLREIGMGDLIPKYKSMYSDN